MWNRIAIALWMMTVSLGVGCASADPIQNWHSNAVDRDLPMSVHVPSGASTRPSSVPAVILLKNLPMTPFSDRAREEAAQMLANDGNAVITIDYKKEPRATNDSLITDLLKIRADIKEKKLVLEPSIDINRLWILPEGFALKRDVTFFKNDQKTWQLDIAYPLKPEKPVPTLMEITCDNASRMGNFSLVFCHDTLVEGALFRGFAAAMIDHPVPAPYKGLDDPMPDLIHRLKSAVRTIRAHADELQLNGKIGALGFSRGGPMAAFLAVTNGRAEFEVGGEHPGTSSDIQAALIHGNRYDYSKLAADDPMLARFEKAWGPRAESEQAWLKHGAAYYFRDSAVPIYLSSSEAESPEYRKGLADFADLLRAHQVRFILQIDPDNRGHQVSHDPARLADIYAFLQRSLSSE